MSESPVDFGYYMKDLKNPYMSIASDGIMAGDIYGFIDSGSYWLNALLSGSIYGGYPNSKITMLAAESSTGKTFLAASAMKCFLDDNPTGAVFLFESESAITKKFLEGQKIDTKRVLVIPVVTIQEFRHQAITILDRYTGQKPKERQPIMFVLDSMGMLSTTKEIADTADGSDTRDMTRAQIFKATFRVLTLKLGVAKIPLILTNHTYECFRGDQLVQTSGGNKRIDSFNVGDMVTSIDGEQEIINIMKYEDAPTYTVELEDGYKMVCTANHKFILDDGSVKRVDELTPEDVIMSV